MRDSAFFDTNVLVCADDESSPEKYELAIGLIRDYRKRDAVVVSWQVLQEYYVTVTCKLGFNPILAQQKSSCF